uniref:Transcription elongation factor 1 homolog n=1 Tax=Kalanchoe fedtschenkoi TaxID=63787 RepID=A0A7N0VKW8_KALFE
MARKKNAKKPAAQKRVPKLDKSFTCPFCHHPESVECTIDKKLKIGKASCYVCSESYCVKINFLTEAIDIYSEWLDACEAANSNSSPRREQVPQPVTVSPRYSDLFDD